MPPSSYLQYPAHMPDHRAIMTIAALALLAGCASTASSSSEGAPPPSTTTSSPAAAVTKTTPATTAPKRTTSAARPTHRSTPKPAVRKTTPPPRLDPRFDTCRQAIAAGYGPYRRGVDPEYSWYRDADHDGIDCER